MGLTNDCVVCGAPAGTDHVCIKCQELGYWIDEDGELHSAEDEEWQQ